MHTPLVQGRFETRAVAREFHYDGGGTSPGPSPGVTLNPRSTFLCVCELVSAVEFAFCGSDSRGNCRLAGFIESSKVLEIEQSHSLEIEEDPAFERRSWRIQRAGWTVMLLFLCAGMLGLLGGAGPLVDTRAGGRDAGAVIEYSRFLRTRAPVDFHFLLDPDISNEPEVRIAIDRAYLERFEIQQIVPEPVGVEVSDSTTYYVFALAESELDIRVTFHLHPERPAFLRGAVRVADRQEIEFWQLVLP
jgi:hypothetical protein